MSKMIDVPQDVNVTVGQPDDEVTVEITLHTGGTITLTTRGTVTIEADKRAVTQCAEIVVGMLTPHGQLRRAQRFEGFTWT